LNINLHNIICIYYPNLEEPLHQIKKFEHKQLNRQKINTALNEFKKKYVDFEIKTNEKTALNNNKQSSYIISTDHLDNIATNNRNRPAPYTVPNRENQNKNIHLLSNERLNDQRKEKILQTNNINKNQPIKPKEQIINDHTTTRNINHNQIENNQRNFSFVTRDTQAIQTNSSLNSHNVKKSCTVVSDSNVSSSQRQLSEGNRFLLIDFTSPE